MEAEQAPEKSKELYSFHQMITSDHKDVKCSVPILNSPSGRRGSCNFTRHVVQDAYLATQNARYEA